MRLGVNSAQAAQNAEGSAVATINGCGMTHAAGVNWTDDTTPSQSWIAICYAPEIRTLVAVSNSGTLGTDRFMWIWAGGGNSLTSWSAAVVAPLGVWQAVCWSPELKLFCAVGQAGAIATSPNGTTWTSRTSGTNDYAAVCWAPEIRQFCIMSSVGASNRVMLSPDGITWSPQTAGLYAWQSVCWSSELRLFVAVANSGNVETSPTGVTWAARTPSSASTWRGVCWSPELRLFCAVGSAGTDRVMTSPDGSVWTARTTPSTSTWTTVAWSPDLRMFCAMSQNGSTQQAMTSPDGINWALRVSGTARFWYGITWVPEMRCFVAVCNNGTTAAARRSGIESVEVIGTAANGSIAAMLGSLGPTGASVLIQGWLRININGTDRYIPYW